LKTMLLDLGNSQAHFALSDHGQILGELRINKADLQLTLAFQLTNWLKAQEISPKEIRSIIYVSVVPSLEPVLEVAFAKLNWSLVKIDKAHMERAGMEVQAEGVGADRLLTAWAGWQIYHQPLLVIDIGTALTFDLVGSHGEFLGGAILPGPGLANQALAWGTEGLKVVPLDWPDEIIGKNTTHAVQSGILFGYTSMVKAMSEKFAAQMGGQLLRLLTGGWAGTLSRSGQDLGKLHPRLTLEGLQMMGARPEVNFQPSKYHG